MTDDGNDTAFYADAKKYWQKVPATIDGMLGGYAHISSADIGGSARFIKLFLAKYGGKTGNKCALDCGAGIGRTTKRLLLPLFNSVDMVEVNEGFLDKAKNGFLGDQVSRIGHFFCCGLQSFNPEPGKYDVIWCQWVLGHLYDDDLVSFFERCKAGLAENGVMMLKENMNSSDQVDFDENDSSLTRPREDLIHLMKKGGFTIIKEERQKNFPKEIFDVRMFALQ